MNSPVIKIEPLGQEGSLLANFYREQCNLLYKTLPAALFANIVLGSFLVWVAWGEVDSGLLQGWYALLVFVSAIRFAGFLRYRKLIEGAAAEKWRRYFLLGSLCMGIVWAMDIVFLIGDKGKFLELIVIFNVAGITSGVQSSSAIYCRSVLAFTLPSLSVLFIYLILEDHYQMAVMIFLYSGLILRFAFQIEETLKQSINLKYHNQLLTGQAQEEKRRLDVKNREMEKLGQENRASRLEAEQANHAKSAFLASMSHEIRTPMNGIMGMLRLVEQTELNGIQRQYIGVARDSSETLMQILNDILDLTKIESGKVDLEIIDFSLGQTMEEISALWGARICSEGLDYSVDIEETVEDCWKGDPTRLKQILYNLVSNALKFTSEGSVRIFISQDHKENILHFEVRDTGIGIDPEKGAQLFEKFVQEDASTSRQYGGTGLGLAICRELVGLMGGEIHFESEKGTGTNFIFTLALEPGDAASLKEFQPVTEDFEMTCHRQIDILLVEDVEINQMVISSYLDKADLKIDIANNGREALEILEKKDFDIILMDIQMPEMDGMETTRNIRKGEGDGTHVPIVALTANAMIGDKEKYLKAGMDDYLSKPVDPVKLYVILAEHITDIDYSAPQETACQEEGISEKSKNALENFMNNM